MPPRPRFDRRAPVRELPNINDRISYPQLRVVDADGEQLGVIDREKALEVARERELDLVLVSEKADPPVCRIMDYGKFKFEQEKKAKEAKKKSHQTEVKEVKEAALRRFLLFLKYTQDWSHERRGEEKEDEGRTRSAMGKTLRKQGG